MKRKENRKERKNKTKQKRTHTLKEFSDNFCTCWIYVKREPKHCAVNYRSRPSH